MQDPREVRGPMEQMEKQVGDIGGYSGVSDLAIFPGKFRLHFFRKLMKLDTYNL